MNHADAAALDIDDGETVKVTLRRGTVWVRARISDITPKGVVSMTFHSPETRTNILNHGALDPVAKIPELKVCTVKIEREPHLPRGFSKCTLTPRA